jgi:predicted PurR-regulated permease PerM
MLDRVRSDQTPDPWGRWGPPIRFVLVAMVVILGLWLLITLQDIVLQLLMAIVLASGLAPSVGWLQQRGLPRLASTLLIYVAFLAGLIAFGIAVVPIITREIQQIVLNAPRYAEITTRRLAELREQFPFLPPLDQQLEDQLRGLTGQLGEIAAQTLAVASVVLGALGGVVTALLVLIIALYLIVDGASIREYFLSFVTAERRPRVRRITEAMGERVGRWFLGQLALSTITGVITFVGLTIIGVPGAALLAFIAAIGEVIPIFGPILSAIPAVTVAAIQSPTQGVITAAFYVVFQQFESYVLAPTIVGRAVKLHPLAVFVALLIGAALLGVLGAILAVPLTAALSVLIDETRSSGHIIETPTKGDAVASGPPENIEAT